MKKMISISLLVGLAVFTVIMACGQIASAQGELLQEQADARAKAFFDARDGKSKDSGLVTLEQTHATLPGALNSNVGSFVDPGQEMIITFNTYRDYGYRVQMFARHVQIDSLGYGIGRYIYPEASDFGDMIGLTGRATYTLYRGPSQTHVGTQHIFEVVVARVVSEYVREILFDGRLQILVGRSNYAWHSPLRIDNVEVRNGENPEFTVSGTFPDDDNLILTLGRPRAALHARQFFKVSEDRTQLKFRLQMFSCGSGAVEINIYSPRFGYVANHPPVKYYGRDCR